VTPPSAPRPLGPLVFASLIALSPACTPGADGSVVGGRPDARGEVDVRPDGASVDVASDDGMMDAGRMADGGDAALDAGMMDAGSDAALDVDAGGDGAIDAGVPDRPTTPGRPMVFAQELAFPHNEIVELRYRADGLLVTCSALGGVQVVDARVPGAFRPLAPTRSSLGGFDYPRCSHVAVGPSLAYATFRADVTQPSSLTAVELGDTPAVVAAYRAPPGVAFDAVLPVGDRLLVAMRRDGVGVFTRAGDTFAPGPVLRGLTNATGLARDGDVVCVADGEGGLVTVDARDPAALRVLGRVATGGIAQTVAVDAAHHAAYVSAGSAGVVIVDVARPEAPALVGRVATGGTVGQIEVVDGRLYVATWRDVRGYDLSVPSRPELFGVVRPASAGQTTRAQGLAVHGDVLAVANWNFLDAYRLLPDRVAPYLLGRPEVVSLGRVAAGASSSALVTVENRGRAPVAGVTARVTDPAFTVAPETLSLAPGESAELRVGFRAGSTAEAAGALVLSAADPLVDELRIDLRANAGAVAVGDPAPPEAARLTDGTTWTLASQRGNVVMLVYFSTW
jgi:hypothetical protein